MKKDRFPDKKQFPQDPVFTIGELSIPIPKGLKANTWYDISAEWVQGEITNVRFEKHVKRDDDEDGLPWWKLPAP